MAESLEVASWRGDRSPLKKAQGDGGSMRNRAYGCSGGRGGQWLEKNLEHSMELFQMSVTDQLFLISRLKMNDKGQWTGPARNMVVFWM